MGVKISISIIAKNVKFIPDTGKFSDNKRHVTFYFDKRPIKEYGLSWKRMLKYQKQAYEYFKDFIQTEENGTQFLILDEIFYVTGWSFKKKLFKSKYPSFYAFTKQDAKKLLESMIDLKDEEGKKTYEEVILLLNRFKDDKKFFFKIAW